ncbi:MAG: hypothetical protein F4Z14_04895 [Gammaproteobacteria bacterium]|nr:hypothetical protein [Gammaproteobacteria bacterium]
MQNLFARSLILLVGLLIGILGVTGVLNLFPDNETSSDSEYLEKQPRWDSEGKSDSTSQVGSDSIPSNINDLVFPNHAFELKMSIVSWVQALSEDQILDWLQQSIEPSWIVTDANRHELQTALLQKLVTTAPERAFEFAWSVDDERKLGIASIVIREWASVDLEGVIAHVNGMDPGESSYFPQTIVAARGDLNLDQQREIAIKLGDESYAFSNYFQNLTGGKIEDPKEIWYEISNLANDEGMEEVSGYALGRVAVAWVEKEGKAVLDEIVSSMSSDSEYDSALPQVFRALAADEPEEIFDYILQNLGDQAPEIIERSRIAYDWANSDPHGLLSRVETLPASRYRRNIISSAVYRWATKKPQQLLSNLELIPPEHQKDASRHAIRKLASTSPSEAAKYVLQVSDYSTQLSVASTLVQDWSYQDAGAAKDWVYGLPESEPLRTALIQPLIQALVYTDPREAFQLALDQPINEQRDDLHSVRGFEVLILSTIAFNDLDLAIELLPQVRDRGQSKVLAYSTIAASLIQRGKTQQAMDLGNQLPRQQQTQYYRHLASRWMMQDPKGLLKAIEEFPTNETKSKVALQIHMVNNMMQKYSDDELASVDKYFTEEDRKNLEAIRDIDLMNPSEEEQKVLEELFPY